MNERNDTPIENLEDAEETKIAVNPKEILMEVATGLGFLPDKNDSKCTASMIATIAAKGVSLLLGILFWVLRGKAKLEGKTCKSRVFLALSILFFIGVLTSRAVLGELNGADDELFDEDFEEEFE